MRGTPAPRLAAAESAGDKLIDGQLRTVMASDREDADRQRVLNWLHSLRSLAGDLNKAVHEIAPSFLQLRPDLCADWSEVMRAIEEDLKLAADCWSGVVALKC